jgi:glutaminase
MLDNWVVLGFLNPYIEKLNGFEISLNPFVNAGALRVIKILISSGEQDIDT